MLYPARAYIQEHPIECMFFSEFHHTLGPKITYQYPESYFQLQNELFDDVVNYIIPKPELQEKLITINTGVKKVIGCPVSIDGSHYPRNNYIFNFGLVLDSKHRSSPCIPLIKQLSRYMIELELENKFVSGQETNRTIPVILREMYEGLNTRGSCSVRVNANTTLYLKVFPPTQVPSQVRDYDVPLLLVPLHEFSSSDWDLTTEQVLPFIDGFRHVQKIAALADVDPNLTRICIRDLMFYRIVELIPIFQYSNTYVTTSNFPRLSKDKELQEQCIQYVSRPGDCATLHDIMTMYCGLSPGVTVEHLCRRYQTLLSRVNERRLVQFGLIHKLIRCTHMYPVKVTEDSDGYDQELQRFFTGDFSTDEICCTVGTSAQDLMSRIESNRSIGICLK